MTPLGIPGKADEARMSRKPGDLAEDETQLAWPSGGGRRF